MVLFLLKIGHIEEITSVIIFTCFKGGIKMHIPDNYLSPATCAVMGAAMIPVWTRAVTKVKKEVTKKKLPLMGVGHHYHF